MATLQIFHPDGEQSHELDEDVITIGRVSDNVIQIDDASVSSHHARITSLDGKFELKDLNSTNGTRVNGTTQMQAFLEDGTKIRFGKIEAVFMSDIAAESIPLPEAEEIGAKIADSTQRPSDFLNASPFGKRSSKKDPASKAIMAFAILAILGSLGAIFIALSMKSPV